MSKTNFSDGSYLTPALANTWYLTNDGHQHDAVDADGHCSKIVLDSGAQVQGLLPSANILSLDPAKLSGPVNMDGGVTGFMGMSPIQYNAINGMNVIWSSGGYTGVYQDCNVQGGSCVDSTNQYYMQIPGTLGQKKLINTARTAAFAYEEGIDYSHGCAASATLAAGWYHVFVIGKSATAVGAWCTDVDFGTDTSVVAANLLSVSGYDLFRRVGSIYITGTSGTYAIQPFYMRNGFLTWTPEILTMTNTLLNTSTYTDATMATPLGVVCQARFLLWASAGGSPANSCGVTLKHMPTSIDTLTFINRVSGSTLFNPMISEVVDWDTSTASQIGFKAVGSLTAPYLTLYTVGYYDYRGQV